MPTMSNPSNEGGFRLDPVRITLIYGLAGMAWIFFSDNVADALFRDNPDMLLQVAASKGVAFVLITSFLLYFLLDRHAAAYRRKEQELWESRQHYRMVVENAPDAIFVLDGLRILFANDAAVKILGVEAPEALVGRDILDFVHAESRDSLRARMARTVRDKLPAYVREQRYRRADGGSIEVEVSAVPFDMGETAAMLLFLRDIRQRKAAECRLRESEQKYRLLAENALDVIFTLDQDMRLTYISPSVKKLLGFTVEEALTMTFERAMEPASAARLRETAHRFFEGADRDANASGRLELEMRRQDGSTVWVESVMRPLLDDGGRFLGLVGASRDIGERRRAEDERRRTQQFLTRILDAIPDPVFVKDSEHRFVLVNEALCAILGQRSELILGRRDEDFVSKEEAAGFVARDNLVLETGRVDLFEEQLTNSQGQVHTLVTRKGLLVDPAGARFIVGVIRDVTRDKDNERRLRDSLQEKEVLLKEVHHRVKNNLQVISSLLYLQKEDIPDPAIQDLFEESRNRIVSMALVHEELYRSGDLARVDIKEYMERLTPKIVQSLRGAKDIGFSLGLVECRVPVDKAIPFGLIVNELVTNAVKHAFRGRDSGHIRVTVGQEDGLVRAEVEDDGVGLPGGFNPEAVKSLGMQLVVQLTRQLRGTLTFGSGPGGAVFRLVFPLGADPQA